MIIRKLSKSSLDKEPYLVWNEFIDILANENMEDLSEIQKVAQLSFLYDSEIQNGGHLQYFENHSEENYQIVIESLKKIGAISQARTLEKAVNLLNSLSRRPIESKLSFVERALEGEYDDLDSEYYETEPTINDYLEKYLNKNIKEFILIVE